jgi:hypothetical protein
MKKRKRKKKETIKRNKNKIGERRRCPREANDGRSTQRGQPKKRDLINIVLPKKAGNKYDMFWWW